MSSLCTGCLVGLLLVSLMAGCGGGTNTAVDQTATISGEPAAIAGQAGSGLKMVFSSVADTYLNEAGAGTNYGGRSVMATGTYWPGGQRVSMVRFDLSKLPANATINSAILRLYMAANFQNPSTYTVHRVTKSWTETGATWTNNSTAYQVTPTDSLVIRPTMAHSYVEFGVRNIARTWFGTPTRNYGCLLRRASGPNPAGVQLATREYAGRAPVLVVDYSLPAGPAPVDLGTAGNFVILAKTGISTTGTTSVVGNLGISPAARSYITGFSDVLDATNVFSRSSLVTGKIYAANMAPPTPANMTTAIANMQTAYTNAAGRPTPDFIDLYSGEIGGRTLVPGLYKWGTGVSISTNVTLNGGPNDVWIFQIAGNLTMASAKHVYLTGGALPKNIFWQVAGLTALGTTADFKGIVLCKTKIVMRTGATMRGRALAQTAVTLDANAVTQPAL